MPLFNSSAQKKLSGIAETKKFTDYSQNTHQDAVNSSVAKLISILRKRYADKFNNHESGNTLREPQESLINYVKSLTNPRCFANNPQILEKPNHAQIKDTVSVINLIHQCKFFNSRQKRDIFEQIISIARNYPLDQWSQYDEILSACTFFSVEENKDITIFVSPAETLNLVACCIMDSRYYVSSDQQSNMITSICRLLYERQIQLIAKRRNQCSTGTRNNLINILNGTIYDSLSGEKKPLKLVYTKSILFIETISNYIETQLNSLDNQNKIKYIRSWLLEDLLIITPTTSTIIDLLRELHPCEDGKDDAWKEYLINLLRSSCTLYGINPAENDILIHEVIDSLENLQIPMTNWNIQPVIQDILKAKECSAEHVFGDELTAQLFKSSNESLKKIKEKLKLETDWTSLDFNELRVFLEYFTFVNDLSINMDNLIFTDISGIKDTLFPKLTTFFNDLSLVHGHEIDEINHLIKQAKNLNRYQEYISNYFAILRSSEVIPQSHTYSSLETMFRQGNIPLLSDDKLTIWKDKLTNAQGEISLSPFHINCILLQMIQVPSSQWTKVQKDIFKSILMWLLCSAPDDDKLLKNFKKSYPKVVLANLLSVLDSSDSGLTLEYQPADLLEKSWLNSNWLHRAPAYLPPADITALLIIDSTTLTSWLSILSNNQESPSDSSDSSDSMMEHFVCTWTLVQSKLPKLITDFEDAQYLLNLNIPELMINDIWESLKGRFKILINGRHELINLLDPKKGFFTYNRQKYIFEELGDAHIDKLIDNITLFSIYLFYSELQATDLLFEKILKTKKIEGLVRFLKFVHDIKITDLEKCFDTTALEKEGINSDVLDKYLKKDKMSIYKKIAAQMKVLLKEHWLAQSLNDTNSTHKKYFFEFFIIVLGIKDTFLMLENAPKSHRLNFITFITTLHRFKEKLTRDEFTSIFSLTKDQFTPEERQAVIKSCEAKDIHSVFKNLNDLIDFLNNDVKSTEESLLHIIDSLSSKNPPLFKHINSLFIILQVDQKKLNEFLLSKILEVFSQENVNNPLSIPESQLNFFAKVSGREYKTLETLLSTHNIKINYIDSKSTHANHFFYGNRDEDPSKRFRNNDNNSPSVTK